MKKIVLVLLIMFSHIFAYDLGDVPKTKVVDIPKGQAVMIEFGKTKCIWCEQMAPYLKSIKAEYPKTPIYYVNVEEDVLGAINNNIVAIPTRIFLDAKGKEIGRVEGYINKEMFLGYLREYGVLVEE